MNKIAWLEWGPEAFDKARSSGKPILLDITGSWCHWCHVMDETSYSDPVIVSTIGKSFIPIRVDTDQRPDVNRRYNLGGWPTTAFLDSDGKMMTGGTYIPPQQLREVLRSVLDFYTKNKGKVRSKLEPRIPPVPKEGPVSEKITRDISTIIAVNFDIDYGGFGFEPKFPHPDALDYALLRYRYHGEKEMLTVATKTLDRMAAGGMYDPVEQGFFRYSTTRDWSIPHFEKMAEDNAKLLVVYLHAFQLTGKEFYKEKAAGIAKFVQEHLADVEHGGFFGSQDADEEYYKLDSVGRRNRKSPSVDRTLYSNYNGLLVSSFLLASHVLDNERLGKFALKTLDHIQSLSENNAIPFHYIREEGNPTLWGFLIDYATLINALIDAFEYSAQRVYLETAIKMADECVESLRDEDREGFFDIPTSDSNLGELKIHDKPIDENSLVSIGLLRLSWHTRQDDYSTIAGKTLRLFNQDYERYGLAASIYALAVDSYLNGPIGITIVASPKSKEFAELKHKALNIYSARRYVTYLNPSQDTEKIASFGFQGSQPTAYVCVGKTCGPPIHDPSQLGVSLTSLLQKNPLVTN